MTEALFSVVFEDQQIIVHADIRDDRTRYRIDWPDGSHDWLYFEGDVWHAETTMPAAKINSIATMIDNHLNNSSV
ncbi:MAG TPA: hypothetical protein VK644_12375 [Chitinophagaceae bacterium]|nr:hypothetical protein [Chitinophagaceae bacterium]